MADDLNGVLDDATYSRGVSLVSGPGSVTFDAANQEIVWTAPLAVGEVATVSYAMTVNGADDLGDGQLLNAITSPDCLDPPVTDPQDPNFNPDCVTIENVEAWVADKTSDAAGNVGPGGVVTYTATVENTVLWSNAASGCTPHSVSPDFYQSGKILRVAVLPCG